MELTVPNACLRVFQMGTASSGSCVNMTIFWHEVSRYIQCFLDLTGFRD